MSFDGQWATSFGPMTLRQEGGSVTGTYGRNGTENSIEGTVEAGQLTFRYEEANERGTGWFRLRRPSSFGGEYQVGGNARSLPWQGWRGFDGLWDTSLGRLRLMQEAGRVWGSSEADASVRLEGDLEAGGRLAFRLEGGALKGGGHFDLDSAGYLVGGEWSEDGQPAGTVRGQRAMPRPGITWLVVLEAHRQRALDDNEYALGRTLREVFARLPWTMVRHRFYDGEASLLHWCRQLLYLPEPAVLVVCGRGEANGAAVAGGTIGQMGGQMGGLTGMIDSLRFADGLKLLHVSASAALAGQEAGRALREAPFPVSGYTANVDPAQCALAEFVYLDMILDKGLTPDKAAEQLPLLVRFAGAETLPGSPYRSAGFTFVGPDARLAEATFGPQPGTVSRSKLH
jgi:hypothetical protein